MKFKYHFSFVLFAVLLTSCSSNPTIERIPEEVIEDPVAALLVFPEDNTECNEGTIISETQSKVVFLWNASEHTDSYELVLTNTKTSETSNFNTEANSQEILLERGVGYEWHIISKSVKSQITRSSETFRFFNAAPGVINHAPFPADAISPKNGEKIAAINEKVTLQWEASDIDNNIKNYEVFMETNNDPRESLGIVFSNSTSVDVVSGKTYYWKIWTQDQTDNRSRSSIFNFTVQ